MSDLIRELRARVDKLVEPHVTLYGWEHPPVKMALLVMAEAEAIERELAGRKLPTDEAAEATGWHPETLQRWARARIDGAAMPDAWSGLQVEETPAGYLFVVGTIPENPRRRNAAA